jgi:hypothetical protein
MLWPPCPPQLWLASSAWRLPAVSWGQHTVEPVDVAGAALWLGASTAWRLPAALSAGPLCSCTPHCQLTLQGPPCPPGGLPAQPGAYQRHFQQDHYAQKRVWQGVVVWWKVCQAWPERVSSRQHGGVGDLQHSVLQQNHTLLRRWFSGSCNLS